MCLTLFCFSKWKIPEKQKRHRPALLDNVNEALML
jgi:hypothetical protein